MTQEEIKQFLLRNRERAKLGYEKLIESVGVNAAGEIVIIKYPKEQL